MSSLLTLTADIVDTVLTANNVLQCVAKFTMHSARMPNVLFIVATKHDGCICQVRSLGDTWALYNTENNYLAKGLTTYCGTQLYRLLVYMTL